MAVTTRGRGKKAAEDTPAFGGIAERLRKAGDLDRAIQLCREGLKKFPDQISARVTLGWALLDQGKYDDARAELELALKRAPDNLAAIRGLAELHDRAESTMMLPMDGPGQWPPDDAMIDAAQTASEEDAAVAEVASTFLKEEAPVAPPAEPAPAPAPAPARAAAPAPAPAAQIQDAASYDTTPGQYTRASEAAPADNVILSRATMDIDPPMSEAEIARLLAAAEAAESGPVAPMAAVAEVEADEPVSAPLPAEPEVVAAAEVVLEAAGADAALETAMAAADSAIAEPAPEPVVQFDQADLAALDDEMSRLATPEPVIVDDPPVAAEAPLAAESAVELVVEAPAVEVAEVVEPIAFVEPASVEFAAPETATDLAEPAPMLAADVADVHTPVDAIPFVAAEPVADVAHPEPHDAPVEVHDDVAEFQPPIAATFEAAQHPVADVAMPAQADDGPVEIGADFASPVAAAQEDVAARFADRLASSTPGQAPAAAEDDHADVVAWTSPAHHDSEPSHHFRDHLETAMPAAAAADADDERHDARSAWSHADNEDHGRAFRDQIEASTSPAAPAGEDEAPEPRAAWSHETTEDASHAFRDQIHAQAAPAAHETEEDEQVEANAPAVTAWAQPARAEIPVQPVMQARVVQPEPVVPVRVAEPEPVEPIRVADVQTSVGWSPEPVDLAPMVPEPVAEPEAIPEPVLDALEEAEALPMAVGANVEVIAPPAKASKSPVGKLKRLLRRIEARRLETAASQWHSQR